MTKLNTTNATRPVTPQTNVEAYKKTITQIYQSTRDTNAARISLMAKMNGAVGNYNARANSFN